MLRSSAPTPGGKLGALRAGLFAFVLATVSAVTAYAQGGYAGTVAGGSGGPTVTVTTLAQLTAAIGDDTARIVNVSGTINLGSSSVRFGSNKTIQGVGTNSGFIGNLKAVEKTNVILRQLNFTNPSSVGDGDGLTLQVCTRTWVDHCSFVDCGDGSLDLTHACDNVTVSWCKFSYTVDSGHNFVNLIGHSDSNAAEDTGKLHITMHHNYYSTLCKERMPRVRFGRVHVYNNYYGSAGSLYNIGVGNGSQILVENCYFENQPMPWKNYSSSGSQGLIKWNTGNVFVNSPVPTWAPNSSSVFTPPYSYSPESGSTVKASVVAGAGAGGGGSGTTLTVSPSSLSFGATAGSQTVTISSNTSWTVSDDQSWITVSPTSGSNNGSTSVSVTANTGAARSGTVTITGGGITRTVSVAQAAAGGGGSNITLQAESGTVGGGTTIDSNNAGFNGTGFANFPASGGSLQLNSVSGGSSTGSRTISVRYANGTTSSRTGRVLVNGVAQNITFAATGAWTTWGTVTFSATLNSGSSNTIRFESNGQDLGNIDQISFTVP